MTLALLAVLNAPPDPVFGYWETPAHSVLRTEPCGPGPHPDVCLRVMKLPPEAPVAFDIYNPDPAQRGRPICGLVVGTGFHPDGPGKLSGGHLYDPKTGHTYQGSIAVEGEALRLRGYLGIQLFGRSETWWRVAAVPVCSGRS